MVEGGLSAVAETQEPSKSPDRSRPRLRWLEIPLAIVLSPVVVVASSLAFALPSAISDPYGSYVYVAAFVAALIVAFRGARRRNWRIPIVATSILLVAWILGIALVFYVGSLFSGM